MACDAFDKKVYLQMKKDGTLRPRRLQKDTQHALNLVAIEKAMEAKALRHLMVEFEFD